MFVRFDLQRSVEHGVRLRVKLKMKFWRSMLPFNIILFCFTLFLLMASLWSPGFDGIVFIRFVFDVHIFQIADRRQI